MTIPLDLKIIALAVDSKIWQQKRKFCPMMIHGCDAYFGKIDYDKYRGADCYECAEFFGEELWSLVH